MHVTSKLLQLSPEYEAEMRLICVGTTATVRTSTRGKKYIILDSHHPITKILIKHYGDEPIHVLDPQGGGSCSHTSLSTAQTHVLFHWSALHGPMISHG